MRKLAEHNPKPQIILMDYRMPIMNGIETMRRIFRLELDTRLVQKPASVKEIFSVVESLAVC